MPLTVLLLAVTCGKESSEEANASEYFYDCEDAKKPAGLNIYATDEAYRAFQDKVAASGFKKDSAQAPKVMAPAANSTISLATPPAFSFTSGMALRTRDVGPRVPGAAPRPRGSRWAWLRSALSFEGTAWAHCPTVTGPLYLVQVGEAGKAPAYTALASVTIFTPDPAVWKEKLQGLSGKKVTLTVARGVFSMGTLELGPFVADEDVSLTVGP
jgi:hypothetical protein